MSMPKTSGDAADAAVFISYRRLDDMPPPEQPKAKGFVGYLFTQLTHELVELGLPKEVLWLDRGKIETADEITQVIAGQLARSHILLAILSRNYVQSGWCREEVEAFAERLQSLDVQSRRRRIFRIDKHDIPDSDLPPAVRDLQAVKFYEKNEEGEEQEYYWRGKVRSRKLYLAAIHDLGKSIFRRLQELGVRTRSVTERPILKPVVANGRTVYVAKPGSDLRDAYETLVRELRGRGYHVVPDPESELPAFGERATLAIRTAIALAEASIHLVGERPGFQPEGSSAGIVSLQLGEAGREASNRSGFERLIWAPKVVPGVEDAARARDPLDVLQTFDARLDSDQIDGDTAARFNEFVLQRLEGRGAPAPAPRKRYVYVGSAPGDEKLISYGARQIQELGASPIFAGDPRILARADHALICWGDADEMSIFDALESPAIESWRAAKPEGRLVLLACPPGSQTKMRACELGQFGPADLVIDGTIEQIRSTLGPLLVR